MATTGETKATKPKRMFWLHQAAEYLLGIVLIYAGLQSPEPLFPAVAGAIVLVNAAIVDGPLSAYRLVGRRLHRVLDWVVVALLTVGALMPGPDPSGRVAMLGIAIVLAILAWQTGYGTSRTSSDADPSAPPTTATGAKAVSMGKAAGRLAGKSAKAVRDRTQAP